MTIETELIGITIFLLAGGAYAFTRSKKLLWPAGAGIIIAIAGQWGVV